MRYLILCQALALSVVTLQQQTCDTGIPVITKVTFPPEIDGDGQPVPGAVDWTDTDAGVVFAYLETVVCPETFACPPQTLDMLALDPEYDTYTEGTINFNLGCSNETGGTAYFTWQWTLEDVAGNLSAPAEFEYACTSTDHIVR